MPSQTYTLKELVGIIAPNASAVRRAQIMRQIRHWTALDLLEPTGGKSTGTGISRRYEADEVRKAAILLQFAHYRVPAPILDDTFVNFAEDWPESPHWKDAIKGRKSIYLHFAFGDDEDDFVICQIAPRDAVVTLLEPAAESFVDSGGYAVSAIVVNLSRLFARLKL